MSIIEKAQSIMTDLINHDMSPAYLGHKPEITGFKLLSTAHGQDVQPSAHTRIIGGLYTVFHSVTLIGESISHERTQVGMKKITILMEK